LLFKMTNFGQPIITVNDMNFQNRSELLMVHLHEGMDLQPDFLTETLKNVYKIWKRPVNLQTVSQEKETIYCYDGEKISFIK
jgi:stage V sporulation protein R